MDSEGTSPLIVILGLVIAVVGMIANGIVVAAISSDKTMRNNSMYLLLANLAVADLLYLCASVGTTAFVKYNGLYLRAFGSYVLQLAIFASICTNVSVCIERYVAVVHSLHFERIFRPRRTVLYVISIWTLAAIVYAPHYLRQRDNPEIRCAFNEIWKECPSPEATCENASPPDCARLCAPSTYQCRRGYVRDAEGICIKAKDCPGGVPTPLLPTCPQNETFTMCSTPEGTCLSFEPASAPIGPSKCECIPGFVRHQARCIHHTDCQGFIATNATVGSVPAPEDCPKEFMLLSDNTFFAPTAKAIVDGKATMCRLGHPACPEHNVHCTIGVVQPRSVCCPFRRPPPFPFAPDVCALGGTRIRSSIQWYWKAYKALDWLLCFALPIVVLSIFYTLTCRRLWGGDTQLQATAAASTSGSAVNHKETSNVASRRAVVRMLILCVVAFYVCYTFPSIAYLIETFVDDRPIISDQVMRSAALLVIIASSVNPFIYTVLSKSFRKRVHQMMRYGHSNGTSASPPKAAEMSTSSTDPSK